MNVINAILVLKIVNFASMEYALNVEPNILILKENAFIIVLKDILKIK